MQRLLTVNCFCVVTAALCAGAAFAAAPPPPASPEMTWQAWLSLATIIAVIAALFLDIASVTAVMFSSTLFLMVVGVISPQDFISGLHTTSIVSIAHLFIVVDPLSKLPRVRRLVAIAMSGGTNSRFGLAWPRFKLCVLSAVLSMFANQNPVCVLLTPMVKQYCRDHGYSPAQFLMPMAFASALGGSSTLVGTSVNLTYNGLMQNANMGSMPFFELLKTTALPTLIVFPYLAIVPSFLLSSGGGMFRLVREQSNNFIAQFLVAEGSPLVGHSVADIDTLMPPSMKHNTCVIELIRASGNITLAPPRLSDIFLPGDVVAFTGPVPALKNCAKLLQLQWVPNCAQQEEERSADVEEAVPTSEERCRDAHIAGKSDASLHVAAASSNDDLTELRARLRPRSTKNSSFSSSAATPVVMRNLENVSMTRIQTDAIARYTSAAERNESPDFVEVVLSYKCPAVGATVGSGLFQRRYGVAILALRKCQGSKDFTPESKMNECVMQVGDTLLLFGNPSFADQFESDFSLISFATGTGAEEERSLREHYVEVPAWCPFGVELDNSVGTVVGSPERSGCDRDASPPQSSGPPARMRVVRIPSWYRYITVLIFCCMIVFTIGGCDVFTTSAVAVVATVAFKVLSMREAVAAIDLNVMLSIVYSFGLGIALTNSGLAAVIGHSIATSSLTDFSLLLVIAGIGCLVTNAITNKACAQVLFPVVVSIYRSLNEDPLPAVIVLCAVSSWAFMTPYGKPTNLIIMGPGGYKARDYAVFGAPICIFLVLAVAVSSASVYGKW